MTLPEGYLEIYKLSVEMADRVSARRAVASSFFLTVQSGLVASLAFVEGQRWSIAIAGAVVASTWWLILRTYRQLNGAKFQVIQRLELSLPCAPYAEEWEILKDPGRGLRHRYAGLSFIEQVVPLVFLAINLIALVLDIS